MESNIEAKNIAIGIIRKITEIIINEIKGRDWPSEVNFRDVKSWPKVLEGAKRLYRGKNTGNPGKAADQKIRGAMNSLTQRKDPVLIKSVALGQYTVVHAKPNLERERVKNEGYEEMEKKIQELEKELMKVKEEKEKIAKDSEKEKEHLKGKIEELTQRVTYQNQGILEKEDDPGRIERERIECIKLFRR